MAAYAQTFAQPLYYPMDSPYGQQTPPFSHFQQQLEHQQTSFVLLPVSPAPPPLNPAARLNKDQHRKLEFEFQKNRKPSSTAKRQIAERFGVSTEKINNWFQNRRAKHKQQQRNGETVDIVYAVGVAPSLSVSDAHTPGSVQSDIGIYRPDEQLNRMNSNSSITPTFPEQFKLPSSYEFNFSPLDTQPPALVTPQLQEFPHSTQPPSEAPAHYNNFQVQTSATANSEVEAFSNIIWVQSPTEWSPASAPAQLSEAIKDLPALIEDNGRKSRGMNNGNRRKAPPSALTLSSSNRSSSYTAGMPSSPRPQPGSAKARRTCSSTNVHRIQKLSERFPAALPSPRSDVKPQWANYPMQGKGLQPHLPVSPYLMSSHRDNFPDVPTTASSGFEGNQLSDASLTTGSLYGTYPLTSPITPFSPIPNQAEHSKSAPKYEFVNLTMPQSAPATQTTFPKHTPFQPSNFTVIEEPVMERRPSLPLNPYVTQDDGYLQNLTSADYSNLVITTSSEDILAPHAGFLEDLSVFPNRKVHG